MALYIDLADEVASQIETGVLRAGERLPSVRRLCATRGLSQSTVMQAYYLLEDRGLISARQRSGYYVNAHRRLPLAQPDTPPVSNETTAVDVIDLLFDVLEGLRGRSVVPLGSAFPSPELFPHAKLAQQLGISARRLDPWRTVEDLPPGNLELRRHIARRYLECGAEVGVDELVITAGASEALLLCLDAVTRHGDLIAIESPAFYGTLQAIQTLGLRAIEIPTSAQRGMDLEALAHAIDKHEIKAVWVMPSFQNPTGALMSVQCKRELVAMLARREIPLIEDDAYAELYFGEQRPPPAKAFDREGLVLHCGSFSKCVAPGHRVGWAAPGRYAEHVRRHKFLISIATNAYSQAAIADFVRHGGYERHLRKLRSALASQRDSMLRAVARYFPSGTRTTRPEGGYFLWIELPPGSVDTLELSRRCLAEGVSIAPGQLFSPRRGFGSYLRLNFGHPWSRELECAVATVGRLASAGKTSDVPA